MKTNYYDFSKTFRLTWWIQSKIFKNVMFYRDQVQHCYCRQINNVDGKIIEDEHGKWFFPRSWLVSYPQLISKT